MIVVMPLISIIHPQSNKQGKAERPENEQGIHYSNRRPKKGCTLQPIRLILKKIAIIFFQSQHSSGKKPATHTATKIGIPNKQSVQRPIVFSDSDKGFIVSFSNIVAMPAIPAPESATYHIIQSFNNLSASVACSKFVQA
jgi:hypothetical protein